MCEEESHCLLFPVTQQKKTQPELCYKFWINEPNTTAGTERKTFPLCVTYELLLLLVCLQTKCAATVLDGSLHETKEQIKTNSKKKSETTRCKTPADKPLGPDSLLFVIRGEGICLKGTMKCICVFLGE